MTRWVLGVCAVVLACTIGGFAGLVGYADYTGALDQTARWRPAVTKSNQPPGQNAPASEWSGWARRWVDDAVHEQAEALLAADEAGFLAPVDPDNAKLVAEHKRRFKVLRAMGLGAWTESVTGHLTPNGGERAWDADLKISYCFGTSSCRAAVIVVGTSWELRNDHLVLVELNPSGSDWNGPRPWETTELSVVTGKRVVVAATKANAWRLKEAAQVADRAAAVADQFAQWEEAPSRYVIFLAGPTEWKTWYGEEKADWSAGWAVPVGSNMREVLIRTQVVPQRDLEPLLKHELTHVTSMAGRRDGERPSAWWLVEGIAEHAMMLGQPVREYRSIPDIRSFVRGSWNGDPAVRGPDDGSSLLEASGRYGIAFLSVRRMADKYGQDKMLDFFGQVVHFDEDLDTASRGALGSPWTTVKADLVKYIRATAG